MWPGPRWWPSAAPYRANRTRTLKTVAACQRPRAGVSIPRLFNSAAAARADMCDSLVLETILVYAKPRPISVCRLGLIV
jgi:hypothetical protein